MTGRRGKDKSSGGSRSPDEKSPPAGQASGSRAHSTSPTEQGKAQIDFQFLNFSHPAQAKTGKTLKAIRSHVTKQQHQRENAAAAARRNLSRQNTSESQLSSSSTGSPTTSSFAGASSMDTAEGAHRSTSPTASPVSISPAPSPPSLPKPLDPNEVYPEEWHPYVPRILEHYFQNLAVDNVYIDGPDHSNLLRAQLFPFMMTDRASLHAVMLFGASHYGRCRGSTTHSIDLLKLRGMAIREVNVAIEDGARATSDQIIAAVAKLAAFEAIFGDARIFHTHMIGLLRIVSLRGGLPALGLDGLLERMLLWIDANAAQYMSTHIYFDRAAFPSQHQHPQPDIVAFTGGLAGQ